MSNLPIKGIPGFDGIDFEFDAPQITDPTKPFPAEEFKNGKAPAQLFGGFFERT
jgi:hypothetical protein